MNPDPQRLYGNKLRVRPCGLCWRDDELLMVSHEGLATGGFWAPPGGGLDFGETVEQRLRTEFLEETGLQISVGMFRFACEFIAKPLHAIELFFEVDVTGGTLSKGYDPELNVIDAVRFMSVAEIMSVPAKNLHGIFSQVQSPLELRKLNGFFRI